MPTPNSNQRTEPDWNDTGSAASERDPSVPDLLAKAEQLKTMAQDVTARLGRLINGLKQQRRQGQAMEAAMNSLRQLRLGD